MSPALELLLVIEQYIQAATQATQQLQSELGQQELLLAVHSGLLPRQGRLRDGTEYGFHGIGCRVEGPAFSVDFDFGPMGRTDGFDAWRLSHYASQFPDMTPFAEVRVVEELLRELERLGLVHHPRYRPGEHLYYLTERGRCRSELAASSKAQT